ncbi:hypothetical protein G7Z17_g4594 [Cylindrodendrum hubeiense]|uniref:Uncharacterized protein n=1 Tax=Cylindrodendrum hubeiense TaxID=595255 RepID=A0A9P5HIT8_9HYPO|nr:hypothetical protein G7Z17_g4594 [Cylindrodendrum hubeiense]
MRKAPRTQGYRGLLEETRRDRHHPADMVRLRNTIAWAISIAPVLATQADISWSLGVVTSDVTFATDNVAGETRLYITAPINITRLQAKVETATLNLYTSPYLSQNETNAQAQNPGPALVYTTTTQPPMSHNEFIQTVYFDIPATPSQDLLLSVDINDGETNIYTVQRAGAVIFYNATAQQWMAWNTGKYAEDVNSALIKKLSTFDPSGQDETAPYTPEVPYQAYQPVDKLIAKDGPVPEESSTSISATVLIDPPATETTIVPTYAPSITEPAASGCKCDPVTVTVTVYADSSATPSPSADKKREARDVGPDSSTPSPFPPLDGNKLEVRDDPSFMPAFVSARITYMDHKSKERPVRFLRVVAHADLYNGDEKIGTWQSIETLNENGEALFQFSVSPGQRIVAHTLYTVLKGDYYVVGTRNSQSDDFQVTRVQLDLAYNPWMVAAGETISVRNVHWFSEYTKALWVADTFHTITEFFSTKVATSEGEMERVNVWYPSVETGTFFGVNAKGSFINLPAIEAQNPAVMAHEYGHFAHYLARSKEFFDGGGSHSFCFNTDVKKQTSFSEGYATALGLMAIDNTHLTEGEYMIYTDKGVDGEFSKSLEEFSCFQKNMNNQEGRIAAALIDLVDRQLDTFLPGRDDLGFMGPNFDPAMLNWCFTPRLIFWRALYENPATMSDYWRKLQVILTSNAEDIAWAILQYNYADFPRDP